MADNLFGLDDEDFLNHLGPSWNAMTPREREEYGPPPPAIEVDEPVWARLRGGVLAVAMWRLEPGEIAAQLRVEAPHLLPLFYRLAALPLDWTDAPRDVDEYIDMLAELEPVTTIRRRRLTLAVAPTSQARVPIAPASPRAAQPFAHAQTRTGATPFASATGAFA